MKKIFIAFLVCLLISGCPSEPTLPNSGSTPPTSTVPPPSVPPAIDVKDKTKPPPVLTARPPRPDVTTWNKKLATDPKNLPKVKPANNTVYYQAEKQINGKNRTVSVVFGDILDEEDAIVNAANGRLEGGSGIDGAIHARAEVGGKDLMRDEAKAYKKLHSIASLPTGSAMVTHTYGLPSKIKMVVFTVGPAPLGKPPTPQQKIELYSAVYNSLVKATEYGAKSISIPAISGNIFGFDLTIGSDLYLDAVFTFFANQPDTSIEHVRLTNFDNEDAGGKTPTVRRIAEAFLKLFP